MSKTMFDTSAADFAKTTDNVIAARGYVRGRLFIEALQREVAAGARVLDFGCGPGRISLMAAEAGYDVDGVDSSTGMIAQASSQAIAGRRVRFGECDGIGNDLETGAYAGIVCSSVIEYIADSDTLLANFNRALKPSGTLAISYCNKRSLWRAYARRAYADKPHYAAQVNIWTFGEFKERLARAGFDVVSGPVFFEGGPFEKRAALKFLCATAVIGTLGFLVARKRAANQAAVTA
jgi:SAM-dependent methyltransferase